MKDKLEKEITMVEGRPTQGLLKWIGRELVEVVVEREGSRESKGLLEHKINRKDPRALT